MTIQAFQDYSQYNIEVVSELLVVIGMLYSNFLSGELELKYHVAKKKID